MSFTSLSFWLFLPVVLALFHGPCRGKLRAQNALLLVASYVFYGWWDWRFLSLIMVSTAVDFGIGRWLESTENLAQRKRAVALSLTVNLGLLAFFKYAGFFIDSWVDAWSALGVEMHRPSLQIILPVGISFYTFQTLSYTLDVYRRQLKASDDWLEFAAYVSFFPQLVAGPIERASRLLPQLQRLRKVTEVGAWVGLRMVAWGLFKKVVIADSAAQYANAIFGESEALQGPILALGVVAFAIQIYGDFSGYSDMAIGLGRLFGLRLKSNFRFPYFSRNVAEFWRRWHISLNAWFRDYLYIPLGGSRGGQWRSLRNVAVVFLVSGLWHGADWKFVIWGGIHAALFVPVFVMGRNKVDWGRVRWSHALNMAWTFALVCFAWVFFRADSWQHATDMLAGMTKGWSQGLSGWGQVRTFWAGTDERFFMLFFVLFMVLEWLQFRRGIRWMWRGIWRHAWVEALFVLGALMFSLRNEASTFIYFAF
ncbi:MAG TPA: membrane-bound O-acyltransferase family protein [Flavobacteriales bacterium]|nr:membrane-bound O-acyltransferase family protein [Flavobacteriales bacterium]